jgi:hypothetical protein
MRTFCERTCLNPVDIEVVYRYKSAEINSPPFPFRIAIELILIDSNRYLHFVQVLYCLPQCLGLIPLVCRQHVEDLIEI